MKAVVICHRIPYPPNKGDKIRSYNIIKGLAQHYEITLLFMIDDTHDLEHINSFNGMAKDIHYDVIDPKIRKYTSALSLIKGTPISVRYFYSSKLQRKLDDILEHTRVDLVFCSSSPTGEYVFRSRHYKRSMQDIVLAMDLIDVDSEKWFDYSKKSKQPQASIYGMEARYLSKYEARIAKEFDHLFLVSEPEKKLFLQKIETDNVTTLPNGVDLNYFSPDYRSSQDKTGPVLVFTGAMDYWPNVDGVAWFVREILPRIKKRFPHVVFFIVGGHPTAAVKALHDDKMVRVTGFVDDVREYVSAADACVVPLRIARGIQNKVLEAMAMGKPVVTTPMALEGIDAEPGKNILLADEPSAFAEQVVRILTESELRQRMGREARKFVEDQYGWKRSHIILQETLHSLHSLGK